MKLFTLLTAAASLLIVSACASTPVPTDERVVVASPSDSSVQPGLVYVSPEAAKVFTLRDIETEINERGFLAVRVFGKTAELSALKWAFLGDITYEFCYSFRWFDADGELMPFESVETPRSTIPGDPIRFVGHAPGEECRNFALILSMASENPSAVSGSDDDEQAADAAADDAETEYKEAVEEAETAAGESYVVPSLREENVSGDKNDVKVIGVSDKGDSSN